jgi:hypothetical protein
MSTIRYFRFGSLSIMPGIETTIDNTILMPFQANMSSKVEKNANNTSKNSLLQFKRMHENLIFQIGV